MKLQDQVCTREQALRLRELGITDGSYFVHGTNGQITEDWSIEGTEDYFTPAWTVAELGEMLPDYIPELGNLELSKSYTDHVSMRPHKRGWWNSGYWLWSAYKHSVSERWIPERLLRHLHQAPSEAQCRAALLVYLLEKNLVTPEDVNNRLDGQP